MALKATNKNLFDLSWISCAKVKVQILFDNVLFMNSVSQAFKKKDVTSQNPKYPIQIKLNVVAYL